MTTIGERRVDVAIIGAGPAGVAAGCAAREEGAQNVVVFERDWEPGGILQQCIHPGFGLHSFGEELTGPEYMHRHLKKAVSAGVEFDLNTMVFKMDPPIKKNGRSAASFWIMNPERGIEHIEAGALILAMGCRERPAGAIGLAGTRPSGVYTAGSAQRLVNMEGLVPGSRVAIMGTGDIGLIMARRMAIQGASVVGVFEIMPWVSGLRRNIAQCLDDFGIPYHLNRLVSELHGKERLEGLTVAEVGPDLKPVPGSEQFVACDTLLLAVGLIPENELSRMAGIDIDASTNGPSVNEFMQTSEECVFAAGNVVVVYDLVDFVSKEGGRAGTFAAMYAAGMLDKPNREISIVPGRNVRLLSPRRLTATEDVTIYLRVARPIERKCRLYADHGLFSKNLRYARPGEMNEVTLTAKKLALLAPNVNSITVGVEAS